MLLNPFSNSKKNDKPPQKKIMSPFSILLLFMFIFFGIIGTLFTVFTLNDPDVMKYMSNIAPNTILYWIFMGFIALVTLTIIIGIFSYFLFNINGSTIFWLFIHFILLCLCSIYFFIVFIGGFIIFLFFTKTESSSSSIYSEIFKENGFLKSEDTRKPENTEETENTEKKGILNYFRKTGKKTENTEKKGSFFNFLKKEKTETGKTENTETGKTENTEKGSFFNFLKKGKTETGKTETGKTEKKKGSFFNFLKKEKADDETLQFQALGGGGYIPEVKKKSNLEIFIEILLNVDNRMFSLWNKLLIVYRIQRIILKSSPATLYNKIMNS
jgi:uncharacterized membrane protein